MSRCAHKEETGQKSQERLTSDLGSWLFGISARKDNNHSMKTRHYCQVERCKKLVEYTPM